MNTEYHVIIADDSDHEKVFAEIQRDGKFLAMVSQEDGPERLVVELPGLGLDESQVARQVPLSDFVAVLERAAKKLIGEGK